MRKCSPYPVQEHNLLNFLALRTACGISPSSLRVGVQALRHYHVLAGMDLNVFSSPRFKLLLQGAPRDQAIPATNKTRRGITPMQLGALATHLRVALDRFKAAMLWSAVTLAFHGLLRVSEYTSSAPPKHLTLSRVHMAPHVVVVDLPFTKSCQYCQGKEISVARKDTATCSVTAMEEYMKHCGWASGPFFMHRGGRALTASVVNNLLSTALPGQGISSHSLRIGGATIASKRGISDHALRAARRWSREAFRKCIRHNVDDRAVSLILA